MKAIINFNELAKNIITVGGQDYEVPKRTKAIDDKIQELKKRESEMGEYESNMQVLYALFGAEKVEQMIPEGEEVDLDKLFNIASTALELFYKAKDELQNQQLEKKLAPVNKAFGKLSNVADKVNSLK